MICLNHYHIKESCKACVELKDQNKMLKFGGVVLRITLYVRSLTNKRKKNKTKQRQVLKVYHNDTFSFIQMIIPLE